MINMKEKRIRMTSSGNGTELSEAKRYEENALRELRSAGYRITMPRVQVIRALGDTDRALSAYAIHEKIISSGGKIDVVSVYRILSTLQEVGLIHHIGIVDGYFPCRIADCQGKRSQVIVNEQTGQVTELRLSDEIIGMLDRNAREMGFEIHMIKVEVTGEAA
jgi:Fur family zinc uptake transcriptional regulator